MATCCSSGRSYLMPERVDAASTTMRGAATLPEGDLASKRVGDGTSKSAVSRRFVAPCRARR